MPAPTARAATDCPCRALFPLDTSRREQRVAIAPATCEFRHNFYACVCAVLNRGCLLFGACP